MPDRLTPTILAALAAVGLEVLALWCWVHAGQIAAYYEPGRPDVMRSAVRAGAAAGVAGAQLVVLWFVTGGRTPGSGSTGCCRGPSPWYWPPPSAGLAALLLLAASALQQGDRNE